MVVDGDTFTCDGHRRAGHIRKVAFTAVHPRDGEFTHVVEGLPSAVDDHDDRGLTARRRRRCDQASSASATPVSGPMPRNTWARPSERTRMASPSNERGPDCSTSA